MNRGAWQVIVHGVARVGQDLRDLTTTENLRTYAADFPGGPVAENLSSQCRGHRFQSLVGGLDLEFTRCN